MDRSHRAYVSLDGPTSSQNFGDSRSWYWRLPAFVASWLLFLGFLALQPLADKEPELRVAPGLLAAFALAFIVIGAGLSVAAFLVCKDWRDRIDVVCLPCLSSSFLGLLILLIPFAISERYDLSKAAGISGTVVALLLSAFYLAAIIFSYHRILPPTAPEQQRMPLKSIVRRFTDLTGNSARVLFPGEAPVHIIAAPPLSAEEEETRRQMARLMHNSTVGPSPDSNRSTYHLDWPQNGAYDQQAPLTPAFPRASVSTQPATGPRHNMDFPAHVQAYYDSDDSSTLRAPDAFGSASGISSATSGMSPAVATVSPMPQQSQFATHRDG